MQASRALTIRSSRIGSQHPLIDSVPIQPIDGSPWAFIAVMGVTGAGKSTFIQSASGDDSVVIGDGLESCNERLPRSMHFTQLMWL